MDTFNHDLNEVLMQQLMSDNGRLDAIINILTMSDDELELLDLEDE